MKKVIYLLVLPVVMLSCLAFARLKKDAPTEKYSVIAGVELLGDDIRVFVDGKSYDTEILYKISASCIQSSIIKPLYPEKITNGKWADAAVSIQTKKGKIVYMTEIEKENLAKEKLETSIDKFYTRLHLKDNDGKFYDKVMVRNLRGTADAIIKPEDKVGFVIDGVFYNENDVRFIDLVTGHDVITNSIIDVRGTKPDEYAKVFTTIFTVNKIPTYTYPSGNDIQFAATTAKSNKVVNVVKFPPNSTASPSLSSGVKSEKKVDSQASLDTNKGMVAPITKNSKIVGVVKFPPNVKLLKGEPKTDYATKENDRSTTAAEKRIIAKTLEDPASPFFNRFHFQREGGNGFDVIAFKLGSGGGTANLDAGGKAAAFIDGKFYNEDNLKKISQDRAATLSFDNAPDRSKREKIPGDDNYAMPFSFKTKVTAAPVDTIKQKAKPTQSKQQKTPKTKATAAGKPVVVSKKSFLLERPTDHQVLISNDSAADAHNRILTQEVIKRIHHTQFYNRIKFTAFDGKDYDYVVCTIGKNLTTAPIKLNAKAGLLIDGIFYDEEAIKKLPKSKTQKLETWYEGLNAKKVPKGYIAALSLRTKSTGQ